MGKDILAERLGAYSVGQIHEFSVKNIRVTSSNFDDSEGTATVSAVFLEEDENIRVSGNYVLNYTLCGEDWTLEALHTESERVTPPDTSDFSDDELILALRASGFGEADSVKVKSHKPNLEEGTDFYDVEANFGEGEVKRIGLTFNYTIKDGWSVINQSAPLIKTDAPEESAE